MKKRNLILSTIALSLILGSVVSAQNKSKSSDYEVVDNKYINNSITEEEFSNMQKYMEENFGYSIIGDSYEEYNQYGGCCSINTQFDD